MVGAYFILILNKKSLVDRVRAALHLNKDCDKHYANTFETSEDCPL